MGIALDGVESLDETECLELVREVDEFDVRTESGWSVMLVGRAVVACAAAKARAEALGLHPWATGERPWLVRLRPDLISGRRLLK